MPGNTEAILYDIDGDPLAVDDGEAIPSGTPLILSGGSDGTNSRYMKVDSSGNQIAVGLGTAGSQTGGIITIQGDPAGTPIPISGNITASNASVGLNDTAIPGSSTLIAGSDGTNLRSLRVFDADTGGGTQWILGVGLRKFAGGGSVELGTSSDPIRIDPTGTTTQPVSGTITANQGGAWTVSGTGNFTVVQPTASNLRAQLASETTTGTAVPSTAIQVGGSDGTNLRPFFTDSSGRQIVIGAAANGAAVTGNPVLVAGSDGTNARSVRTATDGTVRVDPTGTTTQPVSGTVTANQGTSPWISNITQFGSSNVVTGTGVSGAGIPRVTVSNDSSISSTERTFATFTVVGTSIIPANNKSMVSIFNADPTLIIKVHEVYVMNVRSASTTGVLGFFELRRITSHSSGTLLTSERMDTTDTLDSDVTIRTGSTIGGESTNLMWRSLFSTDEWGPGAVDTETQEHVFQTMAPIFSRKTNGTKPLTLRQNEGLTIKFATNTTTGEFDIMLVFTQE